MDQQQFTTHVSNVVIAAYNHGVHEGRGNAIRSIMNGIGLGTALLILGSIVYGQTKKNIKDNSSEEKESN